MANKIKYDPALFSEYKARGNDMESDASERNALYDEMEAMFMLDWQTGKPSDDTLKKLITVSPDPRNAVLGAVRLLTAADPQFSVPYEESDQDAKLASEQIEKWAAAVWKAAGRVQQRPIHYSAVLMGVLFDEVQIGITNTADLLAVANPKNKAQYARAQRIAKQCPFLFEVYDPRTGYPEFDAMGLAAFYRKVKVKSGQVLDRWGEQAISSGLDSTKRNDDIDYCEFWDDTWHIAWIDGKGEPLMMAEHGLSVIPIVAQIVSGHDSFSEKKYQRQPFLYTLKQSGLWERQNLSLTVMYSAIFSMGALPQQLYKSVNPEGDPPNIDREMGGVVIIGVNESYEPLQIRPVDPTLIQGLDISSVKTTDSTIYPQALGQPLGGNAPYSMVSLVSQQGRLPLVPIQRACSSVIGRAVEVALEMIKDGGQQSKVAGSKRGEVLTIKPSDIPDGMVVEANLDIHMPQDTRTDGMVAGQLVKDGLASKRWVRENILNIGQSMDMEKEIYEDKVFSAQVEMQLQAQMQQMQMQLQQQAQQPPQGQGQPQPPQMQGQPPDIPITPEMMAGGQGLPEGMTPEMLQQMMAEQGGLPPEQAGAQPGLPMSGQLPPDMMQGSGLPPEGM